MSSFNFKDFLANKKKHKEAMYSINEAFRLGDLEQVHDKMLKIFNNKICTKNDNFVIKLGEFNNMVGDESCVSVMFMQVDKNKKIKNSWSLNYTLSDKKAEVYSIDFFDARKSQDYFYGSGKVKSNLSIYTLGTSVAFFVPIICHVAMSDDYALTLKKALGTITNINTNETLMTLGNLKYRIYESFTKEDINEAFKINTKLMHESVVDDFMAEYDRINNGIRGGDDIKKEAKMTITKNVEVAEVDDEKTVKAKEEFETKTKDPEQAFKEMGVYIRSVVKGIQPGVIICGAPGVGKTYRIMKQLKEFGYEDEKNMIVIKGKCSTRQLYLSLYKCKDKGQMVVIDDADALVGPKAPEECINILKAALDSTAPVEGRKVSYKIASNIVDDDGKEVPKTIYYNGGVIVITNYNVGQLDTALRGRVFTQSLSFTTAQLLKIIEGIMPSIDNGRVTSLSKLKAYNFLSKVASKKDDIEISIRSFAMCARIFEVCSEDSSLTDDDAESMIMEQMVNQYQRGGSKF